jgi:hypothetical protein
VLIDIGIGIREKEMSLKEEIVHYMKLYEDNYKMAADMVILRIEKRIDSIQSIGDGNYFGYSGDQEFIDGFDIGFVEAFKLIKKEVLK